MDDQVRHEGVVRVIRRSLTTGLIFLAAISMGGIAMAAEKAKYETVLKEGRFEIRRYAPQLIAETVVEGDFDDVTNEGFRRLFGYISGANKASKSIAMTAPVQQEAGSEKIAMTAPVTQEGGDASWRISFLMPSRYTRDTIPEPVDGRIVIREVEDRLIAAYRYTGTWGRTRYGKKKRRLLELIEEKGYVPTGGDIFARYNPPFMPPFLRRNEVLIPVSESRERGARENLSSSV
jgi:hypothetical protein